MWTPKGGTAAAAAFLLLAGCVGPSPAPGSGATAAPTDLAAYLDCPVVDGVPHACRSNATSPVVLPVQPEPPAGWRCVTFSDERVSDDYPHWYTYVGPELNDATFPPETQFGLLYDTLADVDEVVGAVFVRSEDHAVLYTWSGPGAGFVRVPVDISDLDLEFVAVLSPAVRGHSSSQFGNVSGDEDGFPPPHFRFDASLPIDTVDQFWAIGPAPPGQGEPGDWAWTLVLNVGFGPALYHLPAVPESYAIVPSDDEDLGHPAWGASRAHPYNTTIRGGSLAIEASVQPYMVFGADMDNIENPAFIVGMGAQCEPQG